MGVQLNIKDPETVRLARELAGATGKSVTETIRIALEAEQSRMRDEIALRRERILKVVDAARERLTPEQRGITSKEAMDSIYGPDGLPEGS
jgi:antitoxin VapB